jgi:hypothetical protein
MLLTPRAQLHASDFRELLPRKFVNRCLYSSGSSTPLATDADPATTTTPISEEEAAGSQNTQTKAADGEPGSADAESGQPTVAPQDDSAATAAPAEAEPEEELAPAHDNHPLEELPSTGTQ